MLWLSILLAVLLLAATTAYCGLRLADSISSTDPSVSRNFLQVPFWIHCLVFSIHAGAHYLMIFQQVNWTPYFFEDLLALRDTWLLLTILLSFLLTAVLLLLVFLRRRICLAIALIEQGSRAVSQVFSSKHCKKVAAHISHICTRCPQLSSSPSSPSCCSCSLSPGF